MIRRVESRWILVAGCFLITCCQGGVILSFGVFFKPLELDFGWSRGETSSVFTILALANAVAAPMAGRMSDRNHMRAILTASAIIGTPAIALCSTVEHLSNLQALAVAIGIGTGATASVPTSVIQRASLNKSHGGLAFSLVSSGFGVGAFISAPCLNYLILSVGWRNAFLAHSALFFVLLITGIALCARAGMPRQSIGTSITEVKQHVAAESRFRQ